MNMTQRLVKEGNLEQIDSITFKLLNEELLKNKIIEIIDLSNNLEGSLYRQSLLHQYMLCMLIIIHL